MRAAGLVVSIASAVLELMLMLVDPKHWMPAGFVLKGGSADDEGDAKAEETAGFESELLVDMRQFANVARCVAAWQPDSRWWRRRH